MSFSQGSCNKGCIDENALNFNREATVNEGCIYPETFNLTSVGITNHPATDPDGNNWDLTDGPDKFVRVIDNETDQLLLTTSIETFVPVTWKVEEVLALDAKSTILRFELHDQDDNESVLMGKAILEIEGLTGAKSETYNAYPESLSFSGNNGVGFTISMDWTE